MRVGYVSDLHLDHGYVWPEDLLGSDTDYDVIVVAGDLHSKARGALFLNELSDISGAKVVFVPGNHDYWGVTLRSNEPFKFRDGEPNANVFILDKDSIEIDGVMFIGATLWTSFRDDDFIVKYTAKSFMNDYLKIKQEYLGNRYGKLQPDTILQENAKHSDYIFKMIELFHNEKPVVVVSHHAPSYSSQDLRYTGDMLTHCYCNDYDAKLIDRKITWIHGHIHCILDYQIGDTRVLCNPRGYKEHAACLREFLLV
jgi:Icc-related predicted phosphoesterase